MGIYATNINFYQIKAMLGMLIRGRQQKKYHHLQDLKAF